MTFKCALGIALGLSIMSVAESADRSVDQLLPAEYPGQWRPEPGDPQSPSPWWRVFGDPVLVRLEEEALEANPDVTIAMERLNQARALTSRSESARFPELDAGFGPTRQVKLREDASTLLERKLPAGEVARYERWQQRTLESA